MAADREALLGRGGGNQGGGGGSNPNPSKYETILGRSGNSWSYKQDRTTPNNVQEEGVSKSFKSLPELNRTIALTRLQISAKNGDKAAARKLEYLAPSAQADLPQQPDYVDHSLMGKAYRASQNVAEGILHPFEGGTAGEDNVQRGRDGKVTSLDAGHSSDTMTAIASGMSKKQIEQGMRDQAIQGVEARLLVGGGAGAAAEKTAGAAGVLKAANKAGLYNAGAQLAANSTSDKAVEMAGGTPAETAGKYAANTVEAYLSGAALAGGGKIAGRAIKGGAEKVADAIQTRRAPIRDSTVVNMMNGAPENPPELLGLPEHAGQSNVPNQTVLPGGAGTMVENPANPALYKQLRVVNNKISQAQQGKATYTAEQARELMRQRDDVQAQIRGEAPPSTVPGVQTPPELKAIGHDYSPNAPERVAYDVPKESTGPADTKTRGFVETVQDSPTSSRELASVVNGKYQVYGDKPAIERASELIHKDEATAYANAIDPSNVTKDSSVAGQLLMHKYDSAGQHEKAGFIAESLAKKATEAGQYNQAFAIWNKLSPEGIGAAARRMGEKAGVKVSGEQVTKLKGLATKVREMPEGGAKVKATRDLTDELHRVVPTPIMKKMTTLLKAGWLTGVKGAFAGNALGNSAKGLMQKLADVPAAGIDHALAIASGQRSKAFTLRGFVKGFKEGVQEGAKNLKTGVSAGDSEGKYGQRVQFSKSPLGRAAQKYTDTVFNFYSANDRPHFHAALENTLNDLAIVEGKNKGLKGSELSSFVKETVSAPPEDMLTTATDRASEAVFQDKNALGAGLSMLKRGLDKNQVTGAAGDIVLPFTGVPSSIATAVYHYSPAGGAVAAVKGIVQASKGEFTQAAQRKLAESLGTSLTGTGVMWVGAQLLKNGTITLDRPKDKTQADKFDADGKQPYSILVGGKWRSMNYLGPVMSLIAVGGHLEQSLQDNGVSLAAVATGLAGGGSAIFKSSPLQGANAAFNALEDSQRYGGSYVDNLAAGTVPTLVKDAANAMDSKQRETKTTADAIQARIPVLREGLPEKMGPDGQPLNNASGPDLGSRLNSLVDPFKSKLATGSAADNKTTNDFYRAYKPATKAKTEASAKVTKLIKQGDLNQAKRVAEEYNATIETRFGKFVDDHGNPKNLDPQWYDMVNSLRISDSAGALKGRLGKPAGKSKTNQYTSFLDEEN